MISFVLIAVAAGCAAALMFASIISGALISLLLFYLAPLPLMVAALGWGPLAAAIGGTVAAMGLGAIFGLPYCMAFAITVALPSWWLGHLALLDRTIAGTVPSGNGAATVVPDLEWYPVGRILLWISGFAVLTTTAVLLTLSTDAAAITSALRQFLQAALGMSETASARDIEQWIDTLVRIAPPVVAVVAMITLTLNLWLAARVTATSGRLRRSWPDVKGAVLPPMTLAALFAAIACCFTGGLPAMLAQMVAASLLMAYGIIGLAVLHTLTLALKGRAALLGCIYAVLVVLPWGLLAMVALGLADTLFGLRQRYFRRRPPPIPSS